MKPSTKRLWKQFASYSALIIIAFIFMIPVFWMVGTSVKTPLETAQENLRFFPTAPGPTLRSPYIDVNTFGITDRISGLTDAAWLEVAADLESLVSESLERWNPGNLSESWGTAPYISDTSLLQEALRLGIYDYLDLRISDTARSQGGEALLQNATSLITDDLLAELFNRAYRRVALGEVRIRIRDFEIVGLYTGDEWKTTSDHGNFVPRNETTGPAQELRYQFTRPGDTVNLQFKPDDGFSLDYSGVDRVFVSLRGDESWAATQFFIERDGRRYRSEPGRSLYSRDWFDTELRFPGGEGEILEQRNYRMLHHVGNAVHGVPFAVEVELTAASAMGAWWAKISRSYSEAFRQVPFARFLATSFSLAIITILLSIFSATLVGYAFARLEWPGRDVFFILLLATMMLPPQVTMIPQFIIMKELGWYNTLVPLWILSGFGIPFFIFLVRQFLKNIPKTLEDAARVDGCGFLRIYWHVMLPLIKPVMITIAIFTFIATWNNFFAPLIYLNDERLFPVALGLFKFNLSVGQDVSLMMAGAFIASVPSVIVFAVLQRYFIEGVTLTGTKE
ncbi:MAG: ABC transporter permease subunit [Candidatus Sumerlaeia bacterium]|nr:ABC transporter permease subunit [Candidatus Sumerlaeia bacterium]